MTSRDRADRCPGVLRPWIADDGALVRLRLVGGRLAPSALARLLDVAERLLASRPEVELVETQRRILRSDDV